MKHQIPRLKPSQRMKKRYILFSCSKGMPFDLAKDALFSFGIKPLKLVDLDSAAGKGIVRCERGLDSKLRIALEKAGLKPLKTSGSLKTLRELLQKA